MRSLFCFGLIGLATLLAAPPARKNQRDTPRGEPGKFDYYVLSLSWSPQYCSTPAGERDKVQCTGNRKFAFVTHGLWPQYESGYPQFCSEAPAPDRTAVDNILDVMPSARLVRHEWDKHGTCTGLTAVGYTKTIRKAYESITVPKEFKGPDKQVTVVPSVLKKRFIEANKLAGDNSIAVLCTGRFLSEVRICLDKNLKSRACGRDVRDQCRVPELIMQPVR